MLIKLHSLQVLQNWQRLFFFHAQEDLVRHYWHQRSHRYFSHGVKDFKGLDIENEWQDQYEYPVIMLTFSSYARVSIDVFTNDFCNDIILKFYKQFPYLKNLDISKNITPHLLLSLFIDNIKESKIVVLIDGYDSPIIHTFEKALLARSIDLCT